MRDPFLDTFAAEVRGLDLGDDAELLGVLDARGDVGLGDDDRLLRAVLRQRAGRTAEARRDLEAVAAQDSRVELLRADVLVTLGDKVAARAAIDRAQARAAIDGATPAAAIANTRAELVEREGDVNRALNLVDEALAHDELAASRWWHRARLLERAGRMRDAVLALDRALLLEPELAGAAWDRARLAARMSDLATAATWLERALRHDPSRRADAATEPDFARLRTSPRFDPTRASRALHDTGLPAWVLLAIDELAESELTVLDAEAAQEVARSLASELAHPRPGTMPTESSAELARRGLSHVRPIAWGPGSRQRVGGRERCLIAYDAERDHLWLALSAAYPPSLWIDAGRDAQSLRAAIGEWFPRPQRARVDLEAQVRAFLGYRGRIVVPHPTTGRLEPADITDIERHLSWSPFLETGAWGNAFDDDPWPDEIPAQPGLFAKLEQRQREVATAIEERPWSMTWRTRHSRSLLGVELHHDDLVIGVVRYQPSVRTDTVARLNAALGCDYPLDLPIDVVAALLGFSFDRAADLAPQLSAPAEPETIAGLLLVISALRHGDLDAMPMWRHYAAHSDATVRATALNIALAYNYESLLEERSLLEPDADMRAEVEAALDDGIAPPAWDPYPREESNDP